MENKLELVIEKIVNFSLLDTFLREIKNYDNIDKIRANREEALLKETIKDARKNRVKIYQLYDKNLNIIIGIVALSASRLDDKPALLIDYIFISNIYRVKYSGINYSKFLIIYAFEKGLELQKEIGLVNLILYPDSENKHLISYYKNIYGFIEVKNRVIIQNKLKNEKWLYLPLKTK